MSELKGKQANRFGRNMLKVEKKMDKKKNLGICVRCKKNKATLVFTESVLNYAHFIIKFKVP